MVFCFLFFFCPVLFCVFFCVFFCVIEHQKDEPRRRRTPEGHPSCSVHFSTSVQLPAIAPWITGLTMTQNSSATSKSSMAATSGFRIVNVARVMSYSNESSRGKALSALTVTFCGGDDKPMITRRSMRLRTSNLQQYNKWYEQHEDYTDDRWFVYPL